MVFLLCLFNSVLLSKSFPYSYPKQKSLKQNCKAPRPIFSNLGKEIGAIIDYFPFVII